MLLTKEVEVKVHTKTVEYYRSLGYDIPMRKASKSTYKRTGNEFIYDLGNTFVIKVEDLPKYSTEKVLVRCDMCKQKEMHVSYNNYNAVMERTGNYVCKDCGRIKQQNTIEQKYNISNISQLDFIKAKKIETMLLHYGVEYPSQSPEIRAKQIDSLMEHYGVNHPSKSQEIMSRAIATNLERYGVPYASQSDEIKEKMAKTMIERYGVPYSSQSAELREKAVRTWRQNLGVDSPCESPIVREKQTRSLYKHSTQKCSKQQLYLFDLYKINEQCELNFLISRYNVDIYFQKLNIAIEYDGGGHRLCVSIGQSTEKEYLHKEIARSNVIKRAGCKQMRIISSKDKLPSDEILLQMLSEARQYFFDYPEHSWIEYNIDTSTVRNAEHKDGVFFDYGKLRKIK